MSQGGCTDMIWIIDLKLNKDEANKDWSQNR